MPSLVNSGCKPYICELAHLNSYFVGFSLEEKLVHNEGFIDLSDDKRNGLS